MSFSRRILLPGALTLVLWACATSEDPNRATPTGSGGRAGSGSGGKLATGSGGKASIAGTASSTGGSEIAPANGGALTSLGGGTVVSTGGVAGASAVPPSVLDSANVILYYQTDQTSAASSKIFMRLFLENKAATALPLANVSVRYWMTSEVGSVDPHADYHGGNIASEAIRFVDDGANSYAEVTFSGNTLAKGTDLSASEFQVRLEAVGGQFDQSDDWSFDASATARAPNDKITVYLDSKLVWGCEPSGACPSLGAGGASGAGGEPGNGGAGGDNVGGASSGGEGGADGAAAGATSMGGTTAGGASAQGGAI